MKRAGALHVVPTAVTTLLSLAFASCGGGDSTGPRPDPPVISISGVEDGEVVNGPVTILVSVSPASATFQATLDGAPFFSGTTVADPGVHALQVLARNGDRTASRTVGFEIRFTGESVLIVRVFDLGDNDAGGGGDAILLTDSSAVGMEHFLVDAGPAGEGGSDRGYVQERLAALGVDTLEALLLTHAHTDHFMGMTDVLRGTTVEDFVYNGQVRSLSSYTSVLGTAEDRADRVVVPSSNVRYELGFGDQPTELVVIPPLRDHIDDDTDDSSDINDGSLGTAVEKGSFRMFMTGDGEVDANHRWRTTYAPFTADLTALKVGHHGGNDAVFDPAFSSDSPWLSHTDAALQVISANGTTHPLSRALGALRGQTAATYCTNVHGDIEIRVDPGGQWVVTVEKNAGADCVAGS